VEPTLRVAIVGCGRAGAKRASGLGANRLVAACDVDLGRARSLAARAPGCDAEVEWRSVIERRDVDLVIVSTSNDALAAIATAAAASGKHVLVEKPAGRCVAELDALDAAATAAGVRVAAGYNHRFHPALARGARAFHVRRRRAAALDPGALRPRRARGLRARVARGAWPRGRRRADRPGPSPRGPRALVRR
jgi:predicted dehydrogenase